MSRLNVNEATDCMEESYENSSKTIKHVWKRHHVWRRFHTCSTHSPAALFIHTLCICVCSLQLWRQQVCADEFTALSLHHTTSEMLWIWAYCENRISNKSHYVILCCMEPTCMMTQAFCPVYSIHGDGMIGLSTLLSHSNLPTWAWSPVIKRREGDVTEAPFSWDINLMWYQELWLWETNCIH